MEDTSEEKIISSEVEEILEEEEEELNFFRRNLQIRAILTIMGFFCFVLLNMLRVSMSVAIVSMVKWNKLPDTSGDTACNYKDSFTRSSDEDGPFEWGTPLQGHILAGYFYGLMITQYFGAMLAEKISAKYTLLIGTIMSSLGTVLIPVTANSFGYAVIILRIVKGLGHGFIIPSFSVLMGKWIPKSERFRSMCLIGSGIPLGGFFGIALAGIICKSESLGWTYVFYTFGGVGLIWCCFWIVLIYESPLTHPYITHHEMIRIIKSQTIIPVSAPIPYKPILKSAAVWAYVIVGFASFWALALYTTILPLFLSTVFKFNIEMNGVMSSLPFLIEMVVFVLASIANDKLARKTDNPTLINKISISVGLLGFALCMIAITFTGCSRIAVVSLLVLGLGFCGSSFASTSVVPVMISPRFAGTISAIMNTIATTSGITVPTVTGYLIREKRSKEEWRVVFYLSASIAVLGAVVYLLFGSNIRKEWDEPSLQKELIPQMEKKSDGNMQIHLVPPQGESEMQPVLVKDSVGRESEKSKHLKENTLLSHKNSDWSEDRPWRTSSFENLPKEPEAKIILSLNM